jgi:hypothetical protein
MFKSTSNRNDLFHHIQELKIMKTAIQKTAKILFILLLFISLYDKNYAQSITIDTLPVTTDPALILSGVPWTVPAKVASIKIQAWGGGGAGGGGATKNGENAGGGGGAGAYLEFTKTSGLSGTWYYVVGLGADGVTNQGKPGEASWINFIETLHPIAGPNGLQAGRGDGGDKPNKKPVLGGLGGNAADPANSFFPTAGGTGGNIIDGQNGSGSTASASGKGGNAANGGIGGASVAVPGAAGNNGSYPGGGGSGVGPFLNNGIAQNGGNGGNGKIILTITHIDAPTASNQTLCIGSKVSDLVTSNTLSGATIKWYDLASGGTALAPATTLSNKTYYATQTYNDVESDRTAVLVTVNSTPGSISGAAVVCAGTNSTLLTLSGNIGNIIQWQYSSDGINYTNIANATRQSHTFINLTSTTHYRAVVTSGTCATTTTAAATIHVKQPGSWIGAVNADWNNAGNWCGTIPTASTDVTITSEPSNQPLIGTSNANVGSLTIASGASLAITSNMSLNVWGDWTNNGGFTATSGTIHFKKAGDQAIGGANISTFNNVSIEGGGSKVISKDIEINGAVAFTNGYITTANASKLIFKAGSSVATGVANDASFAKVQVVKYGTTDFEFPVGGLIDAVNKYRPIAISNLQSTAATDNFSAEHVASNPLTSFSYFVRGNSAVLFRSELAKTLSEISKIEYWNLSRSNSISSANVTMDFSQYPTSIANAQFLRIAHFDATPANMFWENAPNAAGSSSFDFATKKLTVSNVNSFSPFTIGSITTAALPVTLSSFTAKPTPGNKVSLGWVTSSEVLNKGFRIERQVVSTNGKFEQIGFVGSKAKDGNSQNTLAYSFIDVAPKVGAASFYRLVQEDHDRKLTYSEVRVVKLNGQSISMVFPNPSNGPVTISRTADGKKMNVQVIDQSGKIINHFDNITSDNLRLNIPQSGVYTIKISYPETGEQSTQWIVVQK